MRREPDNGIVWLHKVVGMFVIIRVRTSQDKDREIHRSRKMDSKSLEYAHRYMASYPM